MPVRLPIALIRNFICVFLLITTAPLGVTEATASEGESFGPTWELLSREQKQQFVAGYLFGWKDAAKVNQIATEYVKSNPAQAIESLEKLNRLYDFSDLGSTSLVRKLDRYFKDSDNKSSSLSQAITAIRAGK